MLQRNALRWRLQVHDQNNVCLIYQRASFYTSVRQYAWSRQASTTPGKKPYDARPIDTNLTTYAHSNSETTKRVLARGGVVKRDTSDTTANFDPVEEGGNLLETAYKVGFLKITPKTAGLFIEALFQLQENPTLVVFKRLCAEHRISLDAAYSLARLLLRSRGVVDRHSGRQILLLSSRAGSAKATIYVAKTAMKHNQLEAKDVQTSLQHLEMLTKLDYPIVPALVAQAKIYEAKHDLEEAAMLYAKAVRAGPEKATFAIRVFRKIKDSVAGVLRRDDDPTWTNNKIVVEYDDPELDIATAHFNLGNIQYNDVEGGQMDEGIKNWRIAALEYDDPNAYYNLARRIEGEVKNKVHDQITDVEGPLEFAWFRWATYEWYEFMLKAAASGHSKACISMALFYLSPHYINADSVQDRKLRQLLTSRPFCTWSVPLGETEELKRMEKVFPQKVTPLANEKSFISTWGRTGGDLGQTKAAVFTDIWLSWAYLPILYTLGFMGQISSWNWDAKSMVEARSIWKYLVSTDEGRQIAKSVGATRVADLDEEGQQIKAALKAFGPPS